MVAVKMFDFQFATERSYNTSSFAQLLQRKQRLKKTSVVDTTARSSEAKPAADGLTVPSPATSNNALTFPRPRIRSRSESPPQISSKRRKTQTQERDARRSAERRQRRKCCLCGTFLPNERHQCRKCPTIFFCSCCIVNSSTAHPYPGHLFDRISHRSQDTKGTMHEKMPNRRKGRSADEQGSGRNTASGNVAEPVTESLVRARSSTAESKPYRCWYCKQGPVDFRFECQDCTNTNLCADCVEAHPKTHTLKRIYIDAGRQVDAAVVNDKAAREDKGKRCDKTPVDSVSPGTEDEGSELQGDSADDCDVEGLYADEADPDDSTADESSADESDSESFDGEPSTIFIEEFIEATTQAMEKALKGVMAEAAEFLRQHSSSIAAKSPRSKGRSGPYTASRHRAAIKTRPGRPLRVWLPQDRRRLARLKARGLTDEEIGEKLERTPGAVAQQWRKQHHLQA